MATGTMHIDYSREGILDQLLEQNDADFIENGISELCLTRLATTLTDNNKMAALCVDIVKRWLKPFGYMRTTADTVRIVPGLEASGIDKKYINTRHWLDVLQRQNDVYIANHIPDDPVERFVFHFIRDWPCQFRNLFQDEKVDEGTKLAVLKKQLENVVYYGRKRLLGSTWRMYSLPDEILQQALTGQGATVNVVDSSTGSQLQTIEGQRITTSADTNISTSEADGPKPDKLDKWLYDNVLEYAKAKNCDEPRNLDTWTLVRASFDYKGDNGEKINVRCYAFSGTAPKKISLPMEWWELNTPELFNFHFKKGREILLAQGGEERLGQNMVVSIFNALDTPYKEDLRKLTEFIAFEDYNSAQAMILNNRKDLVTLDYGKYYDKVMENLNNCDNSILRAIESLITAQAKDTVDFASIKTMVTCGGRNKQYLPDMNGLREKIDNEDLLQKVKHISEKILSELAEKLECLPTKHLDEMRAVLGHARCGEDNVLPLLLVQLLKRRKVFLDTRVTFVALDAKHPDGKPFCPTCGKKVRFFSILPSVLRFLGATNRGDCNKLDSLFASLQNQGS